MKHSQQCGIDPLPLSGCALGDRGAAAKGYHEQ
jgi:hypothetical protein